MCVIKKVFEVGNLAQQLSVCLTTLKVLATIDLHHFRVEAKKTSRMEGRASRRPGAGVLGCT